MTFARPQWLWLLWAAGACLFFAVLAARRRGRIVAGWPGLAAGPWRRTLKSLCCILGTAALALAAAGPQLGRDRPGPGPGTPPDSPPRLRLVIALDCSRSMLARDLSPDRLTAAKRLILDVLARLPGVEAGLIGFAGRAWLACPPTPDRAGLALFLDRLSPDDAPLGGTSPGLALEAAGLALGPARPGAVLLVGDGQATVAPKAATLPLSVPVVAVAVGSDQPATVPGRDGLPLRDAAGAPVSAGVDFPALAALARASGGAVFRLSPDGPWPAVAVAEALAALAGPDRKAGRNQAPNHDDTALFLLLGIVLLLADLALAPVSGRAGAVLVLALVLAGPAQAATSAAHNNSQGLAAAARGDHQAAWAAFLAARARDPDDPVILYNCGTAAYRLGRFEAAAAAFDRVATTAPNPALAAKARYNQGNAAVRLGDTAGAITAYEAALALAPDDADTRANLDWLRSRPAPPAPNADSGGGNPDPKQPGASPDGQGPTAGQTAGPDQDGKGAPNPAAGQDNNLPGPTADDAANARLPVPAKDGEAVRQRRATAPGAADDPVLGRIPDLVGPPATPVYSRPTVEKDW
jgi:Ca-activated chloride channel family protein